MPAKKEKESPYVTQTQWMEGMEMIKGFFATLVSGNQKLEADQKEMAKGQKEMIKDQKEMKEDQKEMKGQLKNLEFSNMEIKARLGNLERDNEEIKKNVEMNTQSLNLLTKDLQETQKMEFDIFKQGERITKLEKVR